MTATAAEPVADQEDESPTVHDYLEMALAAAAERQMSTSELMGIFFYYTHSIADSYRQEALREHDDPDADPDEETNREGTGS